MRIAILISNTGTGTNLKAIIDATFRRAEELPPPLNNVKICAVISDRTDALGLEHARRHNLKIEICGSKESLLPLLQKLGPDYICLAGWKQIILDEVILAYPNKILNLHPGLVPEVFPGRTRVGNARGILTQATPVVNPDGTEALWNKGMLAEKAIKNFFDQKATFAGSSVHFLTLEFDFGPVLGRTFEKIEVGDNIESLYGRLKKKENELYVEVLGKLAVGQPGRLTNLNNG